ncbi:TMEM134 (predicted) [Pycnogonum litorale]
MTSNRNQFTIDDAFETDEDDAVRMYGSTIESVPLKPKNRDILMTDNVYIRVQDPKAKDSNLTKNLQADRSIKIPDDALSKDSDSLINDGNSVQKFDPGRCWWKHPKVKENWKIVVAAFVLLFIGLGLIVAGMVVYIIPEIGIQGFAFIIAGLICFIPGVYHVVFIYFASKGKRGFDFYNLPLFN